MKAFSYLLLGILAVLISSCSISQQSLKEPQALIRYNKAEFDYSHQVEGHASVTKVLCIDWAHLLNKQQGKVIPAFNSTVYGISPKTRLEQMALFEIMQLNPGYDFIVYPQYEVKTKAPGLGLLYKKIDITAKARLAISNEVFVPKNASNTEIRKTEELKNNLHDLQASYDALLLDINQIKQEYNFKTAHFQQELEDAKEKALQAQKLAFNKQLEEEDLNAILDADIKDFDKDATQKPQVTAAQKPAVQKPAAQKPVAQKPVAQKPTAQSSTTQKPVKQETTVQESVATIKAKPNTSLNQNTALPPSSSTLMPTKTVKETDVKMKPNSYMLVLASYSNYNTAQEIRRQLATKYIQFNRPIDMVNVGDKYRIGFINFSSRDEVINFRTLLSRTHPECKDAWPYKP